MSETPPGNEDDFLYVITGGKFYRLTPIDVKKDHEIKDSGNDKEVFKTLTNLKNEGVALANLPGPAAGPAASCICIALNLDIFDSSIKTKIQDTQRVLADARAKQ